MKIPNRLLRKPPKRCTKELTWEVMEWVCIDGSMWYTVGLYAIRKAKNGHYMWGYAEFCRREEPGLFWALVNEAAKQALENTYKRPKKHKTETPS